MYGQTQFYDEFNNLSNWTLFGDPLPQHINSIFGRSGIFDNNGDGWYNSGAISNQSFNLSNGFILEANVYLAFTDINGCWAGASIGIANPTYQSWGGYEHYLNVGIHANGYACWGSPSATQGHTIFYGGYLTDTGGYEVVGNLDTAPIFIDQYANGWHTIKIVVGQNRMPKFYINDVLLYTGTQPIADSVFNENRKIIIGDRSSGSAGKAFHDWLHLKSNEVQGLVAFYPLNGNANDFSGNGNNGNIIGGVNGSTDRFDNPNSAMQFNGIDGYIEVPNSPSLQSPSDALTIAGWIYIDAFPGIEVAGIVEKTNSNSMYGQYGLSYQAWSDDGLNFYHSNGIQGTSAPVTLDFLRWYFVAITYDGTTAITYLDGVPIFSQNVSGPIVADDNPLTIGLEAPGLTEYLQGKLDDIRIYNRALSAEEISDLYHENGWGYTTWQANIIVTDANNASKTLIFGQDSLATDSLDSVLGESELPPLPPQGVFDARFQFPTNPPIQSYIDFRNDTLMAIDWPLYFQGTYPITITWNPNTLPYGSFYLVDGLGGMIVRINMKTDSIVTVSNSAISKLYIKQGRYNTVTANVNSGWNLSSAALLKTNMYIGNYYSGYIPNAYKYSSDGGYQVVDTLELGRGYFIKFPQQSTYQIEGLIHHFHIPIYSGWNLIGPFDFPVSVGNITTMPPGILSSYFYEYDNGFQVASTLKPANGYWVKANSNGAIILDPSILVKGNAESLSIISEQWSKIKIKDAAGNKMTLYLSKDNMEYELPPSPPLGIFDARFSTNNLVEEISKDFRLITISGANYPITISVVGEDIMLNDIITGSIINALVKSGEQFVINNSQINILKVSSVNNSSIPLNFELYQNYPNPFNPSTTIKFSIPKEVKVSLDVYNILGEKVKELKNEIMKPGYYSVELNASDLGSGVYFYQISAGDFFETKQMILIK